MLSVRYSSKFKRDFKSCAKRGFDMLLLQAVIDSLRAGEKLPAKNRSHILSGDYKDFRECHIQPDWLLIYKLTDSEVLLYRTGSHSDLFNA